MNDIVTVTLNPAIDQTIYCETFEIDATNLVERSVSHVAGKGINVSRNLHSLGQASTILGVFAGSKGQHCIQTCSNHHPVVSVIAQGETRTNLKIVDQFGTTTELNEKGPMTNEETFAKVCSNLDDLDETTKIVVFSGSVPPGFPKDTYRKMIEIVKKKGIIAILDAGADLLNEGILAGPTLIKPNLVECQLALGLEHKPSFEDLVNLRKHWPSVDNIVVSMGDEGAFFILKNGSYHAQGLPVVSRSTTGAGDAMVAALTFSLLMKEPDEELVRRAIATSAAAVETEGTMPGTNQRISQLMATVKVDRVEEKR